jgi:hypothetical protein
MSAQRSALGYFVTAAFAVFACVIAVWANGEPVRSVGFGMFGAIAILSLVWTSWLSAKSAHGWSRLFVLVLTLTGALVVAVLLMIGFAAVECQSYNNCLFR